MQYRSGKDEDIVKELNKAYHIANSGRKGPVLIDLPMNIQRGDVKNPVYEMSLEEMGLGEARLGCTWEQNVNRCEVVRFCVDMVAESGREWMR